MKRFIGCICLSFAATTSYTQGTARYEADSMITSLKNSKPDVHRIDLLLNLAQYHIFKPGENKKDFDSAQALINEASVLNRTLNSSTAHGYQLLTESILAKEKGQADEAKKMAENAVAVLESGNNKDHLGKAYFELSNYYSWDDSVTNVQKIKLVKQSINTFQQAGNLRRKAASLQMLGDIYCTPEDSPKAIPVLEQAIEVYDSIRYEQTQGAYVLLGIAYLYQNKHGEALANMLKALKTAHKVNDTSMQLCQINNHLGILYQEIDRNDIAVKYLRDGLETALRYNDRNAIYTLANNLAVTYNDLGQPNQSLELLNSIPNKYDRIYEKAYIDICYFRTYLELKQYDKAGLYCDSLLKFARDNIVVDYVKNDIYRLAAYYYFFINRYPEARYYLTKNLHIQKNVNYDKGQLRDFNLWYKLDSAQGNFRSAFNHLLFFKEKADSVFSKSKVSQLQVLGVEYETALKEDSIKMQNQDIVVLTQTNKLQQANLKQASVTRKITIAGIVVAAIIIALLYRQYRQKQKSNNVITQKNQLLQHYLDEKEWLLREIHHRVKNNLQIVMSLLNSQTAYIDNQSALTAIHDSQHRVHAMSLIHQKLYGSENLSTIEVSFYIRELVSYLADSFNTAQRIHFEFSLEPLDMDVSQAVPLGLILNEAITNSIKYAFPDNRSGVISISLLKLSSDRYLLSIADDGIGMLNDVNSKKPDSLGMSLMAGLSLDLDGTFSIENNNGTTIKIAFVHDPGPTRPDRLTALFNSKN